MNALPPVRRVTGTWRIVRFILMALNALGGVGGIVALFWLPWVSVRVYSCSACVAVTTQWTAWTIIRAGDQWDPRFVFGVLAIFALVALNAAVGLVALRWWRLYSVQIGLAGLGGFAWFFLAIGLVLGGDSVSPGSAFGITALLFVFVFLCAAILFGDSMSRSEGQTYMASQEATRLS